MVGIAPHTFVRQCNLKLLYLFQKQLTIFAVWLSMSGVLSKVNVTNKGPPQVMDKSVMSLTFRKAWGNECAINARNFVRF